ncbi:MAG: WecB/TagA/CpsF family glycosyltransferase [Myxococcales bacterium]|nr:WecB/TagA/CpsF family glycosyltransferase [Myxococcales bacterium]
MERVRVGSLGIDRVTMTEALDAVEWLVDLGASGAIFTPNVDHVVLAEEDTRFRDAYGRASLSLADGMPVVWASRLLGRPVPEKVSGSDFVPQLMERAAERGLRVYLLGGGPGVAERAAEILRERGVAICGVDAPLLTATTDLAPIADRIRDALPDVVLVGFGAPKQELFIDAVRNEAPAVYVACGATLDFIAGNVKRAPRWMSASGLEWLYRLCREPRRLWRRYLVRDPKFALILWRQLRDRRAALPPQSAPGPA